MATSGGSGSYAPLGGAGQVGRAGRQGSRAALNRVGAAAGRLLVRVCAAPAAPSNLTSPPPPCPLQVPSGYGAVAAHEEDSWRAAPSGRPAETHGEACGVGCGCDGRARRCHIPSVSGRRLEPASRWIGGVRVPAPRCQRGSAPSPRLHSACLNLLACLQTSGAPAGAALPPAAAAATAVRRAAADRRRRRRAATRSGLGGTRAAPRPLTPRRPERRRRTIGASGEAAGSTVATLHQHSCSCRTDSIAAAAAAVEQKTARVHAPPFAPHVPAHFIIPRDSRAPPPA